MDSQPVLDWSVMLGGQPATDMSIDLDGEYISLHRDAVLVDVRQLHVDVGVEDFFSLFFFPQRFSRSRR